MVVNQVEAVTDVHHLHPHITGKAPKIGAGVLNQGAPGADYRYPSGLGASGADYRNPNGQDASGADYRYSNGLGASGTDYSVQILPNGKNPTSEPFFKINVKKIINNETIVDS